MSPEIKKFNNVLAEFLNKIVDVYPYNKLKTYRNAFLILKIASPSIPVNLFMSGCINYKREITERNESFFLKDKAVFEKANMFGNFTEDCGLSYHWNSLTPNTKTAIWEYVQSLFVLGEIIVNNNKDTFNKYNSLYLSDYRKEISNFHTNFSFDFLKKINS